VIVSVDEVRNVAVFSSSLEVTAERRATGAILVPLRVECFVPAPVAASIAQASGGGWTIPILCLGIGLIACCILIPQADQNRRLVYEKEKLRLDLEQLDHQVAINDQFLKKLGQDPTLSQRLAQRQMKLVPAGTAILDLKNDEQSQESSPYLLVSLPPPARLEPYRAVGGFLADLCRDTKTKLYMMGAGLMLMAAGLVLGAGEGKESLIT